MEEIPHTLQHKNSVERATYMSHRSTDQRSSPHSHDEIEGPRNAFQMIQPQLQERKIFGFEIFIDNWILNELQPNEQWFYALSESYSVEHIKFNPDLNIPDLNGRNIQIFDVEMEKKYQCCKGMLNDIYSIFKKNRKETFSIIIFVPEGMVSLLIGTKGHQINKIMKESHTTIVINQPINRMVYRTAKIQGYHSDIAKACRIIYDILQEKSSIAYSIEKQPSQLDYTKSKIKSKFIFPENLINFLEKKKKIFVKKIQQETKCSIRFESDKDNRLLKKDEWVCTLLGRLEDVQSMLVLIINLAHDYMSEDKRSIDYTMKMLIPANYVTKLIGQKGYMIRDIIERSGGSQIKILSDRQSQRDIKECIISINGSRQNKIDASCLILEQIQCFKNGGPILQSGKSINDNLAEQFKNSIPRRNQDQMKIDTEEIVHQTATTAENITHYLTNQSPHQNPLTGEPNNQQTNKEGDDKSEEEGLIEAEDEEKIKENLREKENKKEKLQRPERTQKMEREERSEREIHLVSNSKHSEDKSKSRSRSRHKEKKKSRKDSMRKKSSSESMQFKHDREYLEMKIVVPKRLASDYKQLRYIESLSKSEITVVEQKAQSNESIVSIKGSLKQNCQCVKLLQKRLLRMRSTMAR